MTLQRIIAVLAVVAVAAAGAAQLPLRGVAREVRGKLAWGLQAGQPDLADVMIAMPDGVQLATDIYLPAGDTPVPAVLMRLPYGKRSYGEVRFWVSELVRRGFAVVVQDMRGRHGSGGVFAPYPNAGPDGAATLDWIIRQPWSNRRAGTLGCSALGESQLMLAAQAHPAHRAMVPMAAGGAIGAAGENGYFGVFEGGVFNLASGAGWFSTEGAKTPGAAGSPGPAPPAQALRQLPVESIAARLGAGATDYEAFLRNFENPEYWQQAGYISGTEPFAAPALFIDTWHDLSVHSTLALAAAVRRAGPAASVIIGAGTHCNYLGTDGDTMVGDLPVSPRSTIGYTDLISRFLAHHLTDAPAPDLPPYTYYVLAEDRWRSSRTWPPEEARPYRLHLSSGGGTLVPAATGITGKQRSFRSDPSDPVPSIGGAVCCTGNPDERSGPVFQNAIENRADVLVYSSAPLERPLRIAGPVRARLQVSADVPDTDLVARLTDVDPQGRSLLVQEGALRLRYRDSFTAPALMQPGTVYTVTVEMRDIAYLFRPGHRLRLHIAGSSFPRLERNLNTGRANYLETEIRRAGITIHSDPARPSVLLLHALRD